MHLYEPIKANEFVPRINQERKMWETVAWGSYVNKDAEKASLKPLHNRKALTIQSHPKEDIGSIPRDCHCINKEMPKRVPLSSLKSANHREIPPQNFLGCSLERLLVVSFQITLTESIFPNNFNRKWELPL